MRIAHLIMVHKNPDQLLRLVNKLNHPKFDFFIHVDAKAQLEAFDQFRKIPNVRFIHTRTNCNWGGFSFVRAIFLSLEEILSFSKDYTFVNLLSGQDYPIKEPTAIYNFYEQHIGKNFISYDENDNTDWWKDSVKRYQQYHLTDYGFKGKYQIEKLLNLLMPVRKFPGNTKLFGSSNSSWWTLSGDCANAILQQFNNNPKLIKFLRFCWGTDEFVIATLVMNSSFRKNVVNNNLRYIDWSEGNAHPKTLGSADFEKLKASQALFARKFDDATAVEILDLLDNK